MKRKATITRDTRETQIRLALDLDGAPDGNKIATGVPFMDHMLDAAMRHGHFAFGVTAHGDLEIDAHHTLEDLGIAFGQALKEALGDKRGVTRFGAAAVPLDEALARVVLDLSGRPYLAWRCDFPEAQAGGLNVRLFHEFFQGLVNSAGMTLHVDLLAGDEDHHCLEAIFKAFGRALRQAAAIDPALAGAIPSTKGTL